LRIESRVEKASGLPPIEPWSQARGPQLVDRSGRLPDETFVALGSKEVPFATLVLPERANQLLKTIGLEVRRKPTQLVRSPHDMALTLEFVAAHLAVRSCGRQLTVLQIGAFDGVSNDPIGDALQMFGWNGVLVEPQPLPFAQLKRLHAGSERIQVYNLAVSDEDGTRDLFVVDPADDLPPFTQQLASFDRSHIERAQRYVPKGVDVRARVRATPVATCTFDTLLRMAAVAHVDVLQIDAEGYDYELLRLFDVPVRLPAIINYEHQHLSRRDRDAAANLLVANGYRLAMSYSNGDTVAYRSEPRARETPQRECNRM
jgi:FkbM family methyltransferase